MTTSVSETEARPAWSDARRVGPGHEWSGHRKLKFLRGDLAVQDRPVTLEVELEHRREQGVVLSPNGGCATRSFVGQSGQPLCNLRRLAAAGLFDSFDQRERRAEPVCTRVVQLFA